MNVTINEAIIKYKLYIIKQFYNKIFVIGIIYIKHHIKLMRFMMAHQKRLKTEKNAFLFLGLREKN